MANWSDDQPGTGGWTPESDPAPPPNPYSPPNPPGPYGDQGQYGPPAAYGAPDQYRQPDQYSQYSQYGQPNQYGYGYAYGGYAPASTTDALAIISLVLSVLGIALCPILAVPGMIVGLISRRRIRESNGTLSGDGIALAGTIIGGIITALIALAILAAVVVAIVS